MQSYRSRTPLSRIVVAVVCSSLLVAAVDALAELHEFEGLSTESNSDHAPLLPADRLVVVGGLLDGFRFRIGTQPFSEAAADDDDFGGIGILHPLMETWFGGGDRYRARITLHDPPELFANPGVVYGRWDLWTLPCERKCTAGLAMRDGDVFVLRGFRLRWNGNHELKRISIREKDGLLTIGMENRPTFLGFWETSPKNFGGFVEYALIPGHLARAHGTSKGAPPIFQREVPPGRSILAGFEFEFEDDEHNLQEIRVETPDDGRVVVEFKDKQSPPYTWAVDWVVIGPPTKGGDVSVPPEDL